jgi:hypothetical protein
MGETSDLFSNEFCPFKFFFKLGRSNMVNGTFWKISEISASDLANSSYGCSPHEKIAKKTLVETFYKQELSIFTYNFSFMQMLLFHANTSKTFAQNTNP